MLSTLSTWFNLALFLIFFVSLVETFTVTFLTAIIVVFLFKFHCALSVILLCDLMLSVELSDTIPLVIIGLIQQMATL